MPSTVLVNESVSTTHGMRQTNIIRVPMAALDAHLELTIGPLDKWCGNEAEVEQAVQQAIAHHRDDIQHTVGHLLDAIAASVRNLLTDNGQVDIATVVAALKLQTNTQAAAALCADIADAGDHGMPVAQEAG